MNVATRARAGRLDDRGLGHLVGYATSRAAHQMRKVFARSMTPIGLRVSEYSILMLVAHNRGVNQKRLGAELDISPPNMAMTIDRMVERGWVERVRSTEDRRAQHVHITTSGRALAEQAQRIAATMEAPALSVLSPAEQALLLEWLGKLYRSAGISHGASLEPAS